MIMPDPGSSRRIAISSGAIKWESGAISYPSGGGSADPTAGLLHRWDAYESFNVDETVTSTIPNLKASDSLVTNQDIQVKSAGIDSNGLAKRAFVLDGSSEYLSTTFSNVVERPFQVFIAFHLRRDDTGTDQRIIDGGTNNEHAVSEAGADEWKFNFGGNETTGGDANNGMIVLSTLAGGSEDRIQAGPDPITASSVGSDDLTGLTIGAAPDETKYAQISVGEIRIHDPTASGYSEQDVGVYMSDRWLPGGGGSDPPA